MAPTGSVPRPKRRTSSSSKGRRPRSSAPPRSSGAGDRTAHRNGSRPRTLNTAAGDLHLKSPKLRNGSCFMALLERRRRVVQALSTRSCWRLTCTGSPTRKVDDLVKAPGAETGITKTEIFGICQDLDHEVGALRDRDISAMEYPYVFLNAARCRALDGHHVVSQAIVVTFGVAADGRREVLGFDVGDSQNETFWTAFLRSLKNRRPADVQRVISDAPPG
ncbi:transposase [Pseudarthrobacter sp. O4]|uniref:transposase n=1 Tax=Pseudarthrobacter sp. O4 TaxID=3418417 RepID=UPI003CED7F9F